MVVFISIKQSVAFKMSTFFFYLLWFDFRYKKGGEDQNLPYLNSTRVLLFKFCFN